MKLTLGRMLLDSALAAARERSAKPIAVAIFDAGGNPVISAREDGCSLFRDPIARAKAKGALGMGVDTRLLAERAMGNPVFFHSVSVATDGDVAFSPGGVLIRDDGGNLLGAIGISGDTGEVDEECALAAVAANLANGASS